MRIDLSGRTAVVSGSTSGIGFAIARGLAESGAAVVLNGRTSASVQAALKRLSEQVPGANAEGVEADLATAEGVASFLRRVPTTDILVNNLGIFDRSRLSTSPTRTGNASSTPM
jgi:NAD(P)-dependent dehydrogenase (short-subunit alcohol dehydrogenase family)